MGGVMGGYSLRKGGLLGSSALAIISINFLNDQALSQDPGIRQVSVTTGQAPAPAPAPPPAETAPPPAAPAETAPPAAPPAPGGEPEIAPSEAKPLPQIQINTERPKPRAVPVPATNIQPTTGEPGPGTAGVVAGPPPVLTPYETGAPSVGGGPAPPPQMASQMTVSGKDLNARPIKRPGEIVEAAPGLIAIEHSDGGKANQYYLRGWNLDHGTDLATFVDDVPINMPSNVHGQGYTDLNFLIPEAVSNEEIRKGPYFADVGDFSNAGNLHINFRDTVEQPIEGVSAGSYGYLRYFGLGSTKLGEGNLLYAGSFTSYDGPWTSPDNLKNYSGLARYSQGTATDGFSITGIAYSSTWHAADQVPLRAITTGVIPWNGELDPNDGGDAARYSLSARTSQTLDNGSWKANAYVAYFSLDLYNDFSYETIDPTYGDEFHQKEDRVYTGGGVSRTFNSTLGSLPTETTFGAQTRYDNITNAISYSYQRYSLAPVLLDHINEVDAAIYAINTMHWTEWFKTTLGWRGDLYAASVNSMLQPANSGSQIVPFGSPKATATLGPFYKTELFVGGGMGYHSDDARGSEAIQVPGSPTTPQTPNPLIVRSHGAEIGVRTKIVPDLDSSISAFYIHQDSEQLYNADAGTTVPGPPSLRKGIEITSDYRPLSWFHLDAALALTHARFDGFDANQAAIYQSFAGYPQAQLGNMPGTYIFNAPWMVAAAGLTLGEKTGWFSSLRWRYFSSRPLTEDGAFQSPPFNVLEGTVGYRFTNGWRLQLDALNMLNSNTDQATYAYNTLLYGDALYAQCYPKSGAPSNVPPAVCAAGVMDYVLHPLEPLAFRVTVAGPIETVNPSAMATELKQALPAYEPPGAHYDWTGLHVGMHVDHTASNTASSAFNLASGSAVAPGDLSPQDWHAGFQLGYDYMFPSRVVLGIEGDVDSGGRKTTTITDAAGTSSIESDVFDSESARLRLGYAVENILLYGTGGVAWSSNQYIRTQLAGSVNAATVGQDEAVNHYLTGWTAGGGVAIAFAKNWNAFAEYRHTSYGSSNILLPLSQIVTNSKTDLDEIEFGVNYKFDLTKPAGTGSAATVGFVKSRPAPLYKARPRAPETYDWTGIYGGGEAGYGWADSSGVLTDASGNPLDPYNYGPRGRFAGSFVGGNYQFNYFVVGVEADRQWGNIVGNSQASSQFTTPNGAFPGGPFTISTTMTDFGSVRARVGYALDRFLIYGTAGWAWGNPTTGYSLFGFPPFAIGPNTRSGWTVGAGVDYAITQNVFGRLEYRYTDFGTAGFLSVPTNSGESRNKVTFSDIRAGIAYKFGPDFFAKF
jgi:opacity protein-like surface antigen